jgi:hypothetical protein
MDANTYDRPDHVRARKAQRLRALASLATSTDHLRRISGALGSLGADEAAWQLGNLATRVEEVFDRIEIPDLGMV